MNASLRQTLFHSAALTALLVAGGQAAQAGAINGGGSTLAGPTYQQEFTAQPSASFHPFCLVGSGNGTSAFVFNTTAPLLSEDTTDCQDSSNFHSPANYLSPSATIHYGASDAYIDGISYSGTAAESVFFSLYDQPLIQIPMLITPVAMAVSSDIATSNTSLVLTDAQVCNILSGSYTDWSQVTGAGKSGALTVIYRSDGSGTSFLTTSHLKAVCNPSGTPIGFTSNEIAAMPTTSFASVFTSTGAAVPSNFVGENGSQRVEAALVTAPTNTGSVGYLSPDWTQASTTGQALSPAAPYVAEIANSAGTWAVTYANVSAAAALLSAPPTSSAEAIQSNWAPLNANPTTGYPIVGATYMFFATCYNATTSAGVATNLIAFLQNHFTNTTNISDVTNGGFVPLNSSWVSSIQAAFLTGSDGEKLNISETGTGAANSTCSASGVVGR